MKLRPIVLLTAFGVLLTATTVGGSGPAEAFRMGGFTRGGFGTGFGRGTSTRSFTARRTTGRTFALRSRGGSRTAVTHGRTSPHVVGRSIYPIPRQTVSVPPRDGRPVGGLHPIPPVLIIPPGGAGPDPQPPVIGGGPGGNGNGGGNNGGGGNNSRGNLPPPGERRFVPDEVLAWFTSNATPQTIARIAQRYGLTQVEAQRLPMMGITLYRWHINNGRSVASIIGTLQNESIVGSVQPNYVFTLQEAPKQVSANAAGDPAQYVLAKLQIAQAHELAMGHGVPVAIIDSEIDVGHPDLDGAIIKTFDALGGAKAPREHGTEMAGAIAAHGRLLGIAPEAQLLAVRAFDDAPEGAKGTSYAILKAIEWAVENGARIINMSFVGPTDPALHKMLTTAYDKDVVLVAAAGNAGPKAAPLYPAADPDVIAVTATDSNDGLFAMANRGSYIAVAAPGVQILAIAPSETYTLTTGTSIAAAHVSGIAALLLERSPKLTPKDIRAALVATAKSLGQQDGPPEAGAGLVNAFRALSAIGDPAIAGPTAIQAEQQ